MEHLYREAEKLIESVFHVKLEDYGPYSGSTSMGPFPSLDLSTFESLDGEARKKAVAGTIDHTLLTPDATPEQVERLCAEALEHSFFSVCVNSSHIPRVSDRLIDSPVAVCAVVGFPLGAMDSEAKAFEARKAVEEGAEEIDMVMPIGLLKSGALHETYEDILAVVESARVPVKVILETCLLDTKEIILASLISRIAGAAFIKTSTGFSTGGAKVEHVEAMRLAVGENMGVKASGGIKTAEQALAMIRAGANRIGSSSGIAIISEL